MLDGPRSVIRTGASRGGYGQAAHSIALRGIPAVSGYSVRLSATSFWYTAADFGQATSLQSVPAPTPATFWSTASGGASGAGGTVPCRAARISLASVG